MKKRRFRTEDWLDLGLTELSSQGAEGVKLEAICKAAGLTRGSFYHHFPDHVAFLVAMARRWLSLQTDWVADQIDDADTSADQMAALSEAAMAIDYRLELGMREIARRVPAVDAIVRQADTTRVEIVGALYKARYGLDERHARELAFLEYAAFNGMILTDPDMDLDAQRAAARLFERMVAAYLAGCPSPEDGS